VVERLDKDASVTGIASPPDDVSASLELPILAVDDMPQNLLALEAVLEPLGLPIVTAASGEDALRLLLERDFSLILLDVRMPGLDGLETARLIKSRERTREVPILFLTAARDEVGDIVRGYGVGAVDYVVKPFDPEVLRSKVAVFARLEESRHQLRRSEALLRGAFDAAPVGKTLLDSQNRIVRANPAFARIVGVDLEQLVGRSILDFCHPADHETLGDMLAQAARGEPARERLDPDLRLVSADNATVWVAPAASAIEPSQLEGDLLILLQWVEVTGRRRAEEARAELLIEQAARELAESQAERLEKLRRLVEPVGAMSFDDLLKELASRLTDAFDADAAEVEVEQQPETGRSMGAHVQRVLPGDLQDDASWEEMPLVVAGESLGKLRLLPRSRRGLRSAERDLLSDAAERISLLLRRAQLHEQERRIAAQLQHGLLPARPYELEGVTIAARLEAAGLGAEVGGDWYDSFPLPDGRLGVVIGDVTGSGIGAASTMGQMRSVTRAFATADPDPPSPASVLTRLQRYHHMTGLKQLLTALYLIMDPSNGSLTWANAGHPPPLLRTSEGEVRSLSGVDSMICHVDASYSDREAVLAPGDMLVLYTDGLVERRGESLDAGMERLAEAVRVGAEDPEKLCAQLLTTAQPSDTSPGDDVTALCLKLSAGGPKRSSGRRSSAPGQHFHLTLSPEVSVPSVARRLLERSFGDALNSNELERAKLAISELTSNAVRHGEGEITLVAELDRERLLVEVIDHGSGFEHAVPERGADQVGGWGLFIVDAETSRWGIDEGNTHVWFEIERNGPRNGAERRGSS
jgi:PAS domain S-box-containing protein